MDIAALKDWIKANAVMSEGGYTVMDVEFAKRICELIDHALSLEYRHNLLAIILKSERETLLELVSDELGAKFIAASDDSRIGRIRAILRGEQN